MKGPGQVMTAAGWRGPRARRWVFPRMELRREHAAADQCAMCARQKAVLWSLRRPPRPRESASSPSWAGDARNQAAARRVCGAGQAG